MVVALEDMFPKAVVAIFTEAEEPMIVEYVGKILKVKS